MVEIRRSYCGLCHPRCGLSLEMENKVYIEKQIERMSRVVRKLCHQKPWADDMTYLMQLPGFGVITAMTILAAIGEIKRFETPQQLASYSGLTPGLEQSGTKLRGKSITKGRAPRIEMGTGGSGTNGGQVRPLVEDEV